MNPDDEIFDEERISPSIAHRVITHTMEFDRYELQRLLTKLHDKKYISEICLVDAITVDAVEVDELNLVISQAAFRYSLVIVLCRPNDPILDSKNMIDHCYEGRVTWVTLVV